MEVRGLSLFAVTAEAAARAKRSRCSMVSSVNKELLTSEPSFQTGERHYPLCRRSFYACCGAPGPSSRLEVLQQPAHAARRGHFQIATPPGSKIGPEVTSAQVIYFAEQDVCAESAELFADP